MIENLFIILAINTFVITILWLSQLKTRRADLIDVYWGPSFFISILAVAIKDNSFQSMAVLISLALLGVWGFRLGIYLLLRNSVLPACDALSAAMIPSLCALASIICPCGVYG